MANAIMRVEAAGGGSGGTAQQNLSAGKTGITFPIAAEIAYTELPSGPSDAYWDFWGPNGTGVIDSESPRYAIGYDVVDGDANGSPGTWLLRVEARPRIQGIYMDTKGAKVVRYVAAIPK